MSTVALFHSVLGVRPGVRDAADRLRAAGHVVHVVDQYDGRVFDSYEEASAFAEGIGYPALMASALAAVEGLPEDLVVMASPTVEEWPPTSRATGPSRGRCSAQEPCRWT